MVVCDKFPLREASLFLVFFIVAIYQKRFGNNFNKTRFDNDKLVYVKLVQLSTTIVINKPYHQTVTFGMFYTLYIYKGIGCISCSWITLFDILLVL